MQCKKILPFLQNCLVPYGFTIAPLSREPRASEKNIKFKQYTSMQIHSAASILIKPASLFKIS